MSDSAPPSGRTFPLKLHHLEEPLQLRPDTYSIVLLEDRAAAPVGELFGPRTGVSTYIYAIWAFLFRKPPVPEGTPWTIETVGGMIDAHIAAGGAIADLQDPINDCLVALRLVTQADVDSVKRRRFLGPTSEPKVAGSPAPASSAT